MIPYQMQFSRAIMKRRALTSSEHQDTVPSKQMKLEDPLENQAPSIVAPPVTILAPRSWKCNKDIEYTYKMPTQGFNVDYYPQFFRRSDATEILHQLDTQIKPYLDASENTVKIMGKVCQIHRQRTAFGDAGLAYSFSGISVPANPWIPLVSKLKECVEEHLGESFNFVLVNRYKDGTDHIGEHRDEGDGLCPQASIASLSFGQHRDFVFRHKDSRGKTALRKDIEPVKLNLEHGSLLVMRPPTNSEWFHALPVRKGAPGHRINMTFRKLVVERWR